MSIANVATNEWNIIANDLKYSKIESSINTEDTSISTNQLYVVNSDNKKQVTFKYQGGTNYDFILPAEAPPTNYNSVLVSNTNNEISWQSAENIINNSQVALSQFDLINSTNNKKVTFKYQGGTNYDFILPAAPPPTNDSSILVASPQNVISWQPAAGVLNKPTIWVSSFESQPPAPTTGTIQRFAASVIATWVNPDQIKITISDKYLPVADRLFVSITYKKIETDSDTYRFQVYTISSTQKLKDGISSVEITKPGGNDQWSDIIDNNKVRFNASQISGEFSITVGVYNSGLSANTNTFTISNLYFANAGWPFPPNVTASSVPADASQYTLRFRANIIVSHDNDITTPDINITDVGAPKISRYTGKYYPTSNTSQYRYGSISTTEETFNTIANPLINNTTTEIQQGLSNLYPDFPYRVETKSQNNISEILSDATIIDFTASTLTYDDGYIDTKIITPTSLAYIYPVYYRESRDMSPVSTNSTPIVYKQNTNWQVTLNGGRNNYIGMHLTATRGSSSSRIMKFSIEDKESSQSYKELVYVEVPGFSNQLLAPTIVSTSDNNNTSGRVNITLASGAPVDYASVTYKQGYYLLLPISNIGINVLTKTFGQYAYKYANQTLRFRQRFYNNNNDQINEKVRDFDYYIADVNPNIAPVVQTATIEVDTTTLTSNDWYTTVSGIKVSRGKVKLNLVKLVVTNMGTYFYRQNWLKYTFLNVLSGKAFDNNAFIINTDLSDINNTFASPPIGSDNPSILPIDTGADSGGASYTSYAINPILTIFVTNITSNGAYNSATTNINIPVVVDYQSVITLSSYNNNVISRPTNIFKRGALMRFPIDLNSETALTTYTAFSIARNVYDHTTKLIDPTANPIDNKVLMLSNGLYCSVSYGGVNSPYRNYTSYVGNQGGIDYSSASSASGDYRYVVFRWSYPRDNDNVNTLRVKISGITSNIGGVLPLKQNIAGNTNTIVTQNDKEIKVYYRFEDNRTTTCNPAYISTSPQDGANPSISSIWINAHVLSDESFMNNIANREKNLIHGGFKSVSIASDNVTYNLATPSFTPSSYTSDINIGPYLYVIVGLPSDVNIAMSHIEVGL